MIIYNAKIYTCDKDFNIIENGFAEFENGIITKVQSGKPNKISDSDINADGKLLFPGFIDAHTHLGLLAAGAGVETEDFNEATDPVTPQMRIADGINMMNPSFADALAAGVTSAAVAHGSANPISGDVAAVKCVGKRIDSSLIKTVGIKFALGENPKMTYMDRDETPITRMAIAACIREALDKAVKYKRQLEAFEADSENEDEPEQDAKSEALLPLLRQEISAHFHCHRADDIFTAVRIAKEYNLKAVLIHCTEGYLIADELAEEGFPAVVGPVICDRNKPELANISEKNAAVLVQNNIKTAICTDHSEVPVQYLPISAAIAVKNGLSEKDAIKALTSVPAEILGLCEKIGSIEVGKDADLCLWSGSPLEIMSKVLVTVVNSDVVFREEF